MDLRLAGIEATLAAALDIDYGIESDGSPDKAKFMEIARSDGLQVALEAARRGVRGALPRMEVPENPPEKSAGAESAARTVPDRGVRYGPNGPR